MIFIYMFTFHINRTVCTVLAKEYEFYFSNNNDPQCSTYCNDILSYLYMKKWISNKDDILEKIEKKKYSILYNGLKRGCVLNEIYYYLTKKDYEFLQKCFPQLPRFTGNFINHLYFSHIYKISEILDRYINTLPIYHRMKNIVNPINILTNKLNIYENIFYFKYHEYINSIDRNCRYILSKNMISEHHFSIQQTLKDYWEVDNLNIFIKEAIVHIESFDVHEINSIIDKIIINIEKIKNEEIFLYIVIHIEQHILNILRKEIQKHRPAQVDYENFFKLEGIRFLKCESLNNISPSYSLILNFKNTNIRFSSVYNAKMLLKYIRGYEFFVNGTINLNQDNDTYLEKILKNSCNDLYFQTIFHISNRINEEIKRQN